MHALIKTHSLFSNFMGSKVKNLEVLCIGVPNEFDEFGSYFGISRGK